MQVYVSFNPELKLTKLEAKVPKVNIYKAHLSVECTLIINLNGFVKELTEAT